MMRQDVTRTWGWPVAIAVVSLAGLVVGLVGEGIWDWLAAICLGLPVALSVWLGVLRRK